MPPTAPSLDLSEFEDGPRVCVFAQKLAALSDDDQRLFAAALGNEQIRNVKILERLSARGVKASKDSLSDHRRGVCTCGK